MLVEVHILQNHAPSNLNRDDTGSPKEAVFGGYKRARISSQCLKRSIRRSPVFRDLFRVDSPATIGPELREVMRKHGIDEALAYELSIRTRAMPEVVKDVLVARGVDSALALDAAAVAARLGARAAGGTRQTGEVDEDDTGKVPPGADGARDKARRPRTKQTMFISQRDVDTVTEYLCALLEQEGLKGLARVAKQVSSSDKRLVIEKDLGQLDYRPVTVDLALFGRMVTSEAFVDVEAASQFAHALSTHKIDHEFDYYTAVDDLERSADDEAGGGADMIGDVEFNSACYYKYFNVHVDGLVDNLTGKAFKRTVTEDDEKAARETAARAIRALIEAACLVTPTGKQNSFAAFQPPSLVWIEIRDRNLPVSYANAFCSPVNPRVREGLEKESALALRTECEALTEMYGLEARKRLLLAKDKSIEIEGTSSSANLKALLDELETEVTRG